MESIAVTIMIVLFVVLMVFVFSTALLTPIIGKKNLLFVVGLGFIVGIIGGAFFIAPIMDDIPGIATSFYLSTSNDVEKLNVDVSTNLDVNQFAESASKINGVKSLQVTGITLKTTQFSDKWKSILTNRIAVANKGIKSAEVKSNDTIDIQLNPGVNPQEVIKKLDNWLMLVGAIDIKYSLAHASVQVESGKVYDVSNELSKDAVVTGIEGPTQDKIIYIKSIIPDKTNVIILCGFIGMFVGLAGVFIDTLLEAFADFKGRVRKREN